MKLKFLHKGTIYGTKCILYICLLPGCHRMVVEFRTTYAISANHHQRCEFESHSGDVYSVQYYVIKFVSYLRSVGGFLRFPQPIKLTPAI